VKGDPSLTANKGEEATRKDCEVTCLKRCSLPECEAACCYDGVYLVQGEEQMICEVVSAFPAFFEGLPANYIVDGSWMGVVSGRKTDVVPYVYTSSEYPAHFNQTRCVFADENHHCRLENISRALGIHKWTFKPTACWLFPLRLQPSGVAAPPISPVDDPDRMEGYPGYSCFASCGKHRPGGQPWWKVLADECDYFEQAEGLPVWAATGLSIREIIEYARRQSGSAKKAGGCHGAGDSSA
jgi:hypothetical protein